MQLSSSRSMDVSKLASSVDWRSKIKNASFVPDQGGCGSCWAHSAIAALEAHADIHTGRHVKLSTQELIDCTENPRHCGGTGGCHGATAELAFERARVRGISTLEEYHGDGSKCAVDRPSALKVQSFVRLPENKASHLMHALATKGPVSTSIDAENLFMYSKGVFSGCEKDTVVNHAVLSVGYGHDTSSGKDYWLIKNSWGDKWGESGYFRLQRHTDEDAYCGTDNKPKDGVYCDDAPPSIRVCGMCGSTSDSAYPVLAPVKPAREAKSFRGHQATHKLLGIHDQTSFKSL